jgi:hypothetical protein
VFPVFPASPRSGALVGWGNAWLAGLASSDEAIAEIRADLGDHGAPHSVDGDGLALGLGRLRSRGARRLRLVLPVPGDVSGLPGPPTVNGEALAAGEAVVVLGPTPPLVLVPSTIAHGPAAEGGLESVHWTTFSAVTEPPPPASLRAAEHDLNHAMRVTTAALTSADLGRARPEILAVLRDRQEDDDPRPLLPPGYPAPAHALLARIGRVARLLELAAHDDGAAITAAEIEARTAALRGLSAAVRRARESVYDAFDASPRLAPPPRSST